MTPILGTIASSWRTGLNPAFESIASQTVTSGTVTSFDFTSIPQTYKHLHIRLQVQGSNRAGTGQSGVFITYNNNTNNLYARHYMEASGGSSPAVTVKGESSQSANAFTAGWQGSNSFTVGIIDIIDYANTSKKRAIPYRSSFVNSQVTASANCQVGFGDFFFDSTAAITSIKFDTTGSDGPFYPGTTISLYGIKD